MLFSHNKKNHINAHAAKRRGMEERPKCNAKIRVNPIQ